MAEDRNIYPMTLLRGETRTRKFVYRPRNRQAPPFDLTGKSVEMRILKPGGEEFSYTESPGISITDPEHGEITIDITGDMIQDYDFLNADYAVLLDGIRLFYGTLTVKDLYE